MATWADIQSWDHNAIIEAEDLIEAEVREAREIIADLEHAANDIRSQGEAPDRMRQRLTRSRTSWTRASMNSPNTRWRPRSCTGT